MFCFLPIAKSRKVFWLLGLINKKTKIFKSIFVLYPANAKYLDHYCFSFMQGALKWTPVLIGTLKQGNKWGLILGVTMTEEEFTKPDNRIYLDNTLKKIKNIASLFEINEINMAGILPSYLAKIKDNPELEKTNNKAAKVTFQAIIKVLQSYDNNKEIPIILLGGMGSVGQKVYSLLCRNNYLEIFIVDRKLQNNDFPSNLSGKIALLVDISRKGTLEHYSRQFWNELIILNETYPEPDSESVRKLKETYNMSILHISGVEGSIYPSLPYAYSGSVPCCAIHDTSVITPILKKL